MRRGVGSVSRQRKKKALIIIPLFLLCLAAAAWYFISENSVFTADGVKLAWFNRDERDEKDGDEDDKVNLITEAPTVTTEKPTEKSTEAPKESLTHLSAKWVTIQNLASESYADSLIAQGVEQVIFTVKDKDGLVHLPIESELTDGTNIVSNDAEIIANSIKKLKDNDVYIIFGVSVLCDNTFARTHRSDAITTDGKTLWLDRDSITWLDPSSENAAAYISEMAQLFKEAGADEIMLTNFSYPYIGKTNLIKNKPDEDALVNLAKEISKADIPMSYVHVVSRESSLTGQNALLLEEYFDRIMITAQPDSEEAKALTESLKDKDKLTYIIDTIDDAPINTSFIYTK